MAVVDEFERSCNSGNRSGTAELLAGKISGIKGALSDIAWMN